MRELKPAEVSPPGRLLKRELDERGWLQADLAEILGRSTTVVNEIIQGKRGITPETARGLADAFGTSAQFWLNREASYRLSLLEGNDTVSRRAQLYAKAPVREMIRRQWIEDSEPIDALEHSVTEFLGLSNIDEEIDFAHAARKSTPYDEPPNPAQFVWLRRALQLAKATSARTFTPKGMSQIVPRLKLLMESPEETRHVPRVLAESGIRFLVIEPLPQTKIDGAIFWLDGSPVIVLSLRFDSIDHFWHTLMHEVAHVWYKDGLNDRPRLDVDIVADRSPLTVVPVDVEARAYEFAANAIVPREEMENFIGRVRPLYSAVRVRGFAKRIQVHAGLVVGQLQHRGEISYGNLRRMLTPIRHFVTTSGALSDGWGQALSVAI